ncbi:TPR-like protein [Calocera cornea HHB12733]|uniref:TPR-like protein n=1 Tax=Calocera cornea HHB12733 TaxID=1353952 RepID=A0A165CRS7_9BASI|nr:TPR-like protein [Calocera cornea HHB12733]
MSETPPLRSSRRQSKAPERFSDGSLSWQQVSEMFPDMDDEEQEDSDMSGDGSNYGEDDEEGDADFDDADSAQRNGMMIDPSLTADDLGQDDPEDDIQDDFTVLVDEMNKADTDGRGSMRNDFTMTEQEMDLRQSLRAAARIGKPRRRGRRRGRAQYSEEVRTMLSAAQNAFVEQNPEEAIRLAREAVRIEPRAAEGWSVLAGVYAELGDADAALKFRVMKAHMTAEPDIWKQLAVDSLALDLPRQALYCYRKVLQIDRNDQDAIWDRAFLLKGIGDFEQALKGFNDLLELHPHNPNVLLQIYQICLELNDLPQALHLYQTAFDFYRKFPPNEELFGIPSLSVLADLQMNTGNVDGAIQSVKSGTRWLQNRSNETFWDLAEDDREYDPQGFVRDRFEGQEDDQAPGYHPLPFELRHRLAVARLKSGNDVEAQIHVDVIRALDRDLHPEYFEYMMEIGDAYFERGLWEEAYAAYDDVHGSSEVVSRHLLTQIGRCLRNLGRLEDAINVLEQVIEVAPDSVEAKLDLVELLEASGQLERAYGMVVQIKAARQQDADNTAGDDAAMEGNEARVFHELEPARRQRKPTTEERIMLEDQKSQIALAIYQRLKSFEDAAEAGDVLALEEWMFQARRLIEMFRQARVLFPADKYRRYTGFQYLTQPVIRGADRKGVDIDQDVADISTRLQESMDDEGTALPALTDSSTHFRGIGFDEWILIIVTYAFRLVRRGEYSEADHMLRHVSYSVVFSKPKYQDALMLAHMAGAMFTGDFGMLKEHTRKMMFHHQFNNDGIRIFMAVLGNNLDAYIAFTETKLGKFWLRELRTAQMAVRGEKLRYHSARQRWSVPYKAGAVPDRDAMDEDDASSEGEQEQGPALSRAPHNATRRQEPREIPLPTKENPVMYTVYGHMLMSVRSFQGALFYFMHAYELNPYDPLLCLSVAVAYLGRSMQRQSDNRHHQIVQGLAFLTRYKTIRQSMHAYGEEIEYNFGRYFHQIGVLHLATKHYQRALDIARARKQAGETIPPQAPVKEAAYNLSLIYATTGAADISRVLYQEWLTI